VRVPLVAAAVCPHPPVLVPEVASGAAAELDALRSACHMAIETLARADRVVVLGGASATGRWRPPYGGSFAPWGIDLRVGEPGGEPLPLSLLVGAWLTDRADAYATVAFDASPAECAALGAELCRDGDVGLLVMGDGSACRNEKAPGYADPRAESFDRAAAEALADGDPAGLLALDPGLAAELLVAGRAAWQVLGGAAHGAAVRKATLLYDDAPYGVGYLVAGWELSGPQ
jgi:hypothetical protein